MQSNRTVSRKWIAAPMVAFAFCAISWTASAGGTGDFTGCPGASGITPTLSTDVGVPVAGDPADSWQTQEVFAGQVFDIQVTGPPNEMGRLMVGDPGGSWMGNPLPLDLTSLGIPGCVLEVPSTTRMSFMLDGNGDHSFTNVTIPLVGLSGCIQVFVRDEDGSTFGGMSDSLCITTVPAPTGVSYADDVHPIWSALSCTNCHPPLGGLDLGGLPSNSYPDVSSLVDLGNPANSEILLKPLAVSAGGVGHGGGDFFLDTTDPNYQTILLWITQGALNN